MQHRPPKAKALRSRFENVAPAWHLQRRALSSKGGWIARCRRLPHALINGDLYRQTGAPFERASGSL